MKSLKEIYKVQKTKYLAKEKKIKKLINTIIKLYYI